jgi:hypothetical protein
MKIGLNMFKGLIIRFAGEERIVIQALDAPGGISSST